MLTVVTTHKGLTELLCLLAIALVLSSPSAQQYLEVLLRIQPTNISKDSPHTHLNITGRIKYAVNDLRILGTGISLT